MVQTLDFMWRTRDDKALYDSIKKCLESGKNEEITILNNWTVKSLSLYNLIFLEYLNKPIQAGMAY